MTAQNAESVRVRNLKRADAILRAIADTGCMSDDKRVKGICMVCKATTLVRMLGGGEAICENCERQQFDGTVR